MEPTRKQYFFAYAIGSAIGFSITGTLLALLIARL